MTSPSELIPPDDESRLAALKPYRVLGGLPDAVFDEMVRLTAKLFNLPIALISLVDADEVWFKANFGLGGTERVARQDSMCSVAVLQDAPTIYNDLEAAPCQLINPAISQALGLRFYAGSPLTASGYNIGTLCLIGRDPHHLTPDATERLESLASVISDLLRLRLALKTSTAATPGLWLRLYQELDQYLTRIDTLKELSFWEDSVDSLAAQAYQRSITEEADIVISTLQTHIRTIEESL